MAKGTHKDLEFHVTDASGKTQVFKKADDAAGFAVSMALSDGRPHDLDVICWSKAAARAYGGDEAVAIYEEDPDASVFERITIRADSQGRIA